MQTFFWIVSASLLALQAPIALAQQSPAQPAGNVDQLEEIVVTAQRRQERLQDVPVSATVTSGTQLQENNITNIQDLAERLPDLKVSAGGVVDLLNIRGVGSGQNFGFEQAVGTFVDGVYRSQSRDVRDALFDIDQVEVLKGPQSTYFGNNTIAGALNITTRKPGSEFEYDASALYGSTIGEYAIGGGVTLPLSSTLSVRLAAQAYGQNGWTHNEVQDLWGPHDRDWTGRISLAWTPTDWWRTDIRVDHDRKDENNDGDELLYCPPSAAYGPPSGFCATNLANNGGVPQVGITRRSFSTEDTYDYFNFTEIAATNRFQWNDFNITALTSYYTHSNSMAAAIAPFDATGVGGESSASSNTYDEGYHEFAQEVRLESPTGRRLEYMLGAYYAEGVMREQGYFGFYFAPFGLFAGPPYTAATPVASAVSFNQVEKTYSPFGASTFHITDQFRFNAGLRYSLVEKTAHSFTTFGTGGAPITGDNYSVAPPSVNANLAAVFSADLGDFPDPSRRDSKLMPSANFQYDITKDAMAYVSYVNGFLSGGFGWAFSRYTFKPEYVNSYETGIKANLLDHRLLLTAAAFLSNYNNLQENTNEVLPNGVLLSEVQNAAKARSDGLELSAAFRANRYLTLHSDLAYLDARYISYPGAPCIVLYSGTPGCTQNLSGRTRAFAPKVSGNVGARFTVPVPGELEARFDPLLYFTSEYEEGATLDPLFRQAGYAKLDLRAALGSSDDHWEVAVIGKNLTDRATASVLNSPGIAFGSVYALTDPPRTIAVQFSIKH